MTIATIYDRDTRRWRRPTKYERMRAELPYGLWTEEDGSQVLFNRDYHPIWRRKPDGTVGGVDDPIGPNGKRWIYWISQDHFFNDGNPPWRNEKTRDFCFRILNRWGVGGAS
jgi:hypothetical protein